MKEDDFWRIIAASRDDAKRAKGEDDFAEVHMDALKAALLKLKPEEIIAFDAMFTQASHRAYRWDLWAAAYWLGGGCSDDGFMDFRACLVSLGKDWYDRVLANPDALADTVDRDDIPYMQAEGFQYLAGKAYEELTGEDMPDPDPATPHPAEPAGQNFDFDDAEAMRNKLPKLTARLPEMGS